MRLGFLCSGQSDYLNNYSKKQQKRAFRNKLTFIDLNGVFLFPGVEQLFG